MTDCKRAFITEFELDPTKNADQEQTEEVLVRLLWKKVVSMKVLQEKS